MREVFSLSLSLSRHSRCPLSLSLFPFLPSPSLPFPLYFSPYLARRVRERVPDRGPLPVEVPGPLDLVGGGGDPPVKERPRVFDVDFEEALLLSSYTLTLLRKQVGHARAEILPGGAEVGLPELGGERLREVDLARTIFWGGKKVGFRRL